MTLAAKATVSVRGPTDHKKAQQHAQAGYWHRAGHRALTDHPCEEPTPHSRANCVAEHVSA